MMMLVTRQVCYLDSALSSTTDCTIDAVSITNARLLGALVKVLPPATSGPLIKYAKSMLLFF